MDSDNPRPNEKGKSGRLPFSLIEWETRVINAIGMGKISVSPEIIKQLISPKKFGNAPDIPEFEDDEFNQTQQTFRLAALRYWRQTQN